MKCIHGRLPNATGDASYNTTLINEIAADTRVLDLRWVPLHSLDVAHLQQLEELYLHENGLHTLGESISCLPKIRVLSLGRNHIRTLPVSIKKTWLSLRRLILGHNQIQTLPFIEDDMVLEHGSIGSNPLCEPVGTRWMFRKDAQQSIIEIRKLIRPSMRLPATLAKDNVAIAIDICRSLDEPMIYEGLYAGYVWANEGIVHPEHDFPLEREVLTHLLPFLRPDVLLGDSLAQLLRCH